MVAVPLAQHPALAPLLGPPALAPAESLTGQAARLADHILAAAPLLPPRYVTRKALDAVAFSLEGGLRDLAVPTKLVGVAAHQLAVEALLVGEPNARLVVATDMTAHTVRSDGSLRPLGRIQPKHAAWLAPLLERGAQVHVHAVTGLARRARGLHVTLGVNVTVSALAHALRPTSVAEAPVGYHVDPTPKAIRDALVPHLDAYGVGVGDPSKDAVRHMHEAHRAERDAAEALFVQAHAGRLLDQFADGREVDPARVAPRLVRVAAGTDDSTLFRLATRLWSVPVSRGFGRRLRYLVRDDHNGKLVGLIALGSPVFNLRARDAYVGWSHQDRERRLTRVMDAFVLGAVEPYASLLGGKLVGALVASREIADHFSQAYAGVVGRVSGRADHPDLALVTTMSALGRSSVYNRLRLASADGSPLVRFEPVGYTAGHGHFHIPLPVFEAMRRLLVAQGRAFAASAEYESGPGRRLRILREGLAAAGLDADLARHGVQREVFCVPTVPDWRRVLLGQSDRSSAARPDAATLGQAAVDRWTVPRAARRPGFRAWTRADTAAGLGLGAQAYRAAA